MIEKPTPDVLTLSTTFYDASVSRNLFAKAELRQFCASGTDGLKKSNSCLDFQKKKQINFPRLFIFHRGIFDEKEFILIAFWFQVLGSCVLATSLLGISPNTVLTELLHSKIFDFSTGIILIVILFFL